MLEFQLTPNSITGIHVWMVALLGTSFFLSLFFVLQLLSPRFVVSSKYDRFGKCLLAALASLQIFAWQLYLYSDSHDTVALWCFPLALAGGALVWQLTNASLGAHQRFVQTMPVAIVLVSFGELAGFSQVTRHFSETNLSSNLSNIASDVASPGILVEKTAICGTTDHGKPIKLFERQITTEVFREYLERCRSTFSAMSEGAMLRAQPFVQANCHGWVFTQGQHIIKGEDVELILSDNHYTEVSKPRSNDVAVYRSYEGSILHTGVVRGSLEGATIVESKWGMGALYMHIAEEQPYSQNITYYRTDRPSHDILISSEQQRQDALSQKLALKY